MTVRGRGHPPYYGLTKCRRNGKKPVCRKTDCHSSNGQHNGPWPQIYPPIGLHDGLGCIPTSTGLYGGTAPKFCMFHKRVFLALRPVEHTKLRSYTSVRVLKCGIRHRRKHERHEKCKKKENINISTFIFLSDN